MRGTLTHTGTRPAPRAFRRPSRAARRHTEGATRARIRPSDGLVALLTAMLALLSIGCPFSDGDEATGAKVDPTTYAWPDAPTHPVLQLQIASPDASGTIQIELMPELAPETVARIIALAEQGYYDGTTFHRVVPGFMVQGGDPNSRDRNPDNDGFGGFDEALPDEFSEAPFVRGVVGMGNRGIEGSTSAQLFIMHADNTSLDGRYNAIGRVLDGLEVVDAITRVSIDRVGRWGPKDRPIENVVIEDASIVGEVAAIRAAMELERTAANGSPRPAAARFQGVAPGSDGPSAPPASPRSPDSGSTGEESTPPAAPAP